MIVPINSLNDFISELKKILTENDDYSVYFRGQNNSYLKKEPISVTSLITNLKPPIYRYPQWIKAEDMIFRDAILSNPDEFISEHSTFEKLVKMQHYKVPTRLLDLTTNALMALYFACEERED